MSSFKHKVLAIAALVVCGAASATPTASQIYSGEHAYAISETPGSLLGTPVSARAAFSSVLQGVSSYGFEQSEGGNLPLPNPYEAVFTGSSGSITATISGAGTIKNSPSDGRFNTTVGGRQFWEVAVGGTGASFSISFDKAISAFGFYGSDIGDFDGTLELVLDKVGGGTDTLIVRDGAAAASGNLLFYGFADAGSAYTKVTFVSTLRACTPGPNVTCPTADYFGFDDFVVGDAGQVITQPPTGLPEPGSLALVGLSLLGLAAARRKAGAR